MVGTGSVQDVLVLLDLTLGPLAVGGTTVLANSGEDRQQTESSDGLLVHNVQLVADGGNGQTGGGRQGSGLGDQGVAGDGVQDRLRLLSGLLGGNVGSLTRGGQVGSDGRDTTGGKGRPKSGCAYGELVTEGIESIRRSRFVKSVPMALLARREAIVADGIILVNGVGERN